MNKKIVYLVIFFMTIVIGTIAHNSYCSSCDSLFSEFSTANNIDSEYNNFGFMPLNLDNAGVEYKCSENFSFLKNNFSIILPINDSISLGIDKLKASLVSRPDRFITITGYSSADETNTSLFPNLALARAEEVKIYLISKGFAIEQLNTEGKTLDKLETDSNILVGPIKFRLGKKAITFVDEKRILKKYINENPLIFYFSPKKFDEALNEDDANKLKNIISFMNHYLDAVVLVSGHTDNTGDYQKNTYLAQKRSDFIKSYLVQKGIPSIRIQTISKGATNPISDNISPEGKSKNRRTVITIK